MAYAYTSEQMEKVVLSNLRKGGFSAEILASIISRAEPDASALQLISRRALAHGLRPML